MLLKPLHLALLPLLACGLVACGGGDDASSPDPANPSATETPMPVEPDGGIGDGAGPPVPEPGMPTGSGSTNGGAAGQAQATFPVALRGKWRETDGPAVTKGQCDGYQQDNMGKVLTIREDRYSFFETGGNFITVEAREPGRIRAVFDTTYADEPTRDELEFRVDPVAKTLTMQNFDADEQRTTTYRRCPG